MKRTKLQLAMTIFSLVLSLATLGLLLFNMTTQKKTKKVPDTYVVVKETNGDTTNVLASGWNLTTKQGKEDNYGNHPTEVVNSKGETIAKSNIGSEVTVDVGTAKNYK
nr:MAG TPA: hypothetical protein [Caudoviricetes sp.]